MRQGLNFPPRKTPSTKKWRLRVNKQQKQDFVQNLRKGLGDSSVLVVTTQSGMTVSEAAELRAKMREAGASFKVVKNTLAKIAIKDTKYEKVSDLLKGPIALAYSSDPIAATKVAVDYAKANEKLQLVGGIMDERLMEVADVKKLASLPSLDELRAKIAGIIMMPATQIATLIREPAAGIARVLQARSQQG